MFPFYPNIINFNYISIEIIKIISVIIYNEIVYLLMPRSIFLNHYWHYYYVNQLNDILLRDAYAYNITCKFTSVPIIIAHILEYKEKCILVIVEHETEYRIQTPRIIFIR